MTVLVNKISGALQIGRPADFFSSERSQKSLQVWGLLGGFALSCAPFLSWQHPALMTTWQSEIWAAWLGLLFCAPLLSSTSWRTVTIPAAAIPAALLGLIAVAQALCAQSATLGVSDLYVAEMLWAVLLALSAMRYSPAALRRAISTGLIASGLAGGVLGLIQAAQIPAFAGHPALYAQDGLAYGFVAQRNLFADLQAMALLSVAFLDLGDNKAIHVLRWCAVVILAASAAASGSNALLAYAGAMALWGGVLLLRKERIGATLLSVVTAAVLVGVAVTFFRAHAQNVTHIAGTHVLFTLWMTALHTILQHPLRGIGLGQTPGVFYDLAAALPQTPQWVAFHAQGWNNVHNIVLQLWLEAGLPGLLVALLCGVLLVCAVRQAKTIEQEWAVALLGIIALRSMVEFPLWTLPFLGLGVILLAIAAPRLQWRLPQSAGVIPVAITGMLLALSVLLVQLSLQFSVLMQIWGYPFDARNIGANMQVFSALQRMQDRSGFAATTLRPLTTLVQARFPVTAIAPQDWPQMSAHMQSLQRLMPSGYVPYVNAQLLAMTGQPQSAQSAVEKAVRAAPAFAQDALRSMQSVAPYLPDTRIVVNTLQREIAHAH